MALWSLKDNDLTGMAFIDTQLYIHQMISVKNFILAADLMKSISLLRYQEESKTLSLVSRVTAAAAAARGGEIGSAAERPRRAPVFPGRTRSPWRCTAWTSWWTAPSWGSWVRPGATTRLPVLPHSSQHYHMAPGTTTQLPALPHGSRHCRGSQTRTRGCRMGLSPSCPMGQAWGRA